MKKTIIGDIIWAILFLAFVAMLIFPSSREAFVSFTTSYSLIAGFIKFAVLATMGEMLASRVVSGQWKFSSYFIVRVIIWGIIGIILTLIFSIYATGVSSLMEKGILPWKESNLAFGFFTSAIMNLTFGPVFMYYHRMSDTYLDLKAAGEKDLSVTNVVNNIDTAAFWRVVVGKTIIFFWIPVHTITFMLPSVFRIITAAFLSIALGLILSFTKKKAVSEKSTS